ncbi:MAG: helix-turn-helix domain-containing protein [Chlamydiales bacterium]|nr:helix-turn-helix domain-containing protein [Chlamydiales bacterium]
MTPISAKYFSNSPELEGSFQHVEDLQKSTIQKSSEIAMAVLSSPSQKIVEGALSNSWDFSDCVFSPSDFPSDLSHYEQGSFSLEDLFVASEPLAKRIRFSEPEEAQNPTLFSEIEAEPLEISSCLKPFEGESKSVSQLDEFGQLLHTSETSDLSGELMSEFVQFPLDSHEGFMQKELARREETVGFQKSVDVNEKETHEEIRKRPALSEDQIVLDTLQENHFFGADRLCNKLKQRNINIPANRIRTILRRYRVETLPEREEAAKTGWARFKASPIQAPLPKLAPLPRSKAVIDSSLERKVVAFACEKYWMTPREMEAGLRKLHTDISERSIRRILERKGLDSREKRENAVCAPNQK